MAKRWGGVQARLRFPCSNRSPHAGLAEIADEIVDALSHAPVRSPHSHARWLQRMVIHKLVPGNMARLVGSAGSLLCSYWRARLRIRGRMGTG